MSSPSRYLFCERHPAGLNPHFHIRRVGPEGTRFGGGLHGKITLCGVVDFACGGWDIEIEDIDAVLAQDPGGVCRRCREAYEKVKTSG